MSRVKREYFGRILGKRIYWYAYDVETRCKYCKICGLLLKRGREKKYKFHLPVCVPCRIKGMEQK